jgi:Spy/CpxP family protein refolding chaperone
MKRILTSALILALSIGAAQAQSTTTDKKEGQKKERKGDFKGHHKGHKGGGYEKLNLTADQQSRMKAVQADFKKQHEALKAQESTLTVTQMKEKRKALHQQHRTQMESILTKEQKAQIAKMKAERKASVKAGKGDKGRFDSTARRDFRKGGVKGEARGQRGAEFGKELNLTADQQTKMQQVRTDFRTKMEAVRNDNALTQEQKKTKFQELAKAQQAQLKSILTKEQQEKMQSLRKERPARNTR